MASIKLKGDTSGELTIQAPSVAGTNTLNLPASSGTLATTAQASIGMKNLIINGNMQIAQRGTSVSGITSENFYTVDRWRVLVNGGTWTQSQDTEVPPAQGFGNSVKMLCTTANSSPAANNVLQIRTRLEGQNLQHLKYGTASAESLTLSFWVKSNKTGTYVSELYNADAAKQVSKTFTINDADTWEKKTITFDGDTLSGFNNDNENSLQVGIFLSAGTDFTSGTLQTTWASATTANRAVGQVNLADNTSNYINITGVQLEVGTTATNFEHLQYGQQLALCQRYFEKSAQQATPILTASDATYTVTNIYNNIANGDYYATVPFVVTKRASPTVVLYPFTTPTNTARWSNDGGTDYAANSATTPNGPKEFGFSVANSSGVTLTVGSPKLIIGGWYASAEL